MHTSRITVLLILSIAACSSPKEKQKPQKESITSGFSALSPNTTGVNFRNDVKEDKTFNYLRYSYMYNGGGVAIGDFNNDGLADLYLSSNQGSNKLYLNRGDFKFEDITQSAGVQDDSGWTTGVSVVDINADGLPDIYVCKSGLLDENERRNKLFINNGDNTFTESAAEYGIDDPAYSTMAYFFDYDGDGDLDMYLVNHRIDFMDNIDVNLEKQQQIEPQTSDKLYRNDGNRFVDVTREAGLENKTWGLAAAISDFNNDGLPDIYVCNDFREPDHLYLNNGDGTFTDGILEHFGHISFYSMGADMADINHDGYPDLMVLDMVSEDHVRSKRMMASMSPENFQHMVDIGYHHQYMFNMLHLNRGNGDFSNIAHLAGVAKTDWSWAPLFADFDNDGHPDLFVTNGIRRDVTDVDFKREIEERFKTGQPMSFDEVMSRWPADHIANYAFRNKGNLQFENKTADWGLDAKINSNGVAYVDLNNDGALDIVINNIDDAASIYRNNHKGNHLRIKLNGPENNPLGIGARVLATTPGGTQMREQYLQRGFQSSVDPVLHFGLGDNDTVTELEVIWPDGRTEKRSNVAANQQVELDYARASGNRTPQTNDGLFTALDAKQLGIDFVHSENEYNDFEREILLPHKQSTLGPGVAVGDLNGDGLDDFFVGNAHGAAAATFFQTPDGKFVRKNEALWKSEAKYEDTGALLFDANGNGFPDLYVVSGGNEFSPDDPLLQDRLYLNDGSGNFRRAADALPVMLTSGQCVVAEDIDGDGDLDLFVGGRLFPGVYPFPARSYILINNNGIFTDATSEIAPDITNIGMITDAVFADYDGDGHKDLILVGEWTPFMAFRKVNGTFQFDRNTGLEKSNAWWYSVSAADMDGDGDIDFVAGNLGLNNKFQPSPEKPLHVFCNDFDGNGTYDIVLSKERDGTLLPVRGRECSAEQMPFVAQKFPTFKSFAEADLGQIYGHEALAGALHYVAYDMSSAYFENLGNGKFTRHALPNLAQFGPVLSTQLLDVNQDGFPDIIGVGNKYNAETETVRYDACRGFVLLNQGDGKFKEVMHSGLYNFGNARHIELITIGGISHFMVINNNGSPSLYRVVKEKIKPKSS